MDALQELDFQKWDTERREIERQNERNEHRNATRIALAPGREAVAVEFDADEIKALLNLLLGERVSSSAQEQRQNERHDRLAGSGDMYCSLVSRINTASRRLSSAEPRVRY